MADISPEMMELAGRLQPSELERSLDHLVVAVLFVVAVIVFYFIRDRRRKRRGH